MARINVLEHAIHVDNRQAKREMDEYTAKVTSTARKTTAKTKSMSSAFAGLRTNIGLVGAGMAGLGAGVVFQQFSRFINQAERIQSVSAGFEALTARSDDTADLWLTKMRPAARGLVTDLELMKQANNAIILGVAKNADEMGVMTEQAIKLGRALGRDAAESVKSLVTGLGRQSRQTLDNIGIIVSAEFAQKKFAEANNLTVESLTDAQRKTAFMEEAARQLTAGVEGLGASVLTASDRVNQLGTFMENTANKAIFFWNVVTGATINRDLAVTVSLLEKLAAFRNALDRATPLREAMANARAGGGQEPASPSFAFGAPPGYPGQAQLDAAKANLDAAIAQRDNIQTLEQFQKASKAAAEEAEMFARQLANLTSAASGEVTPGAGTPGIDPFQPNTGQFFNPFMPLGEDAAREEFEKFAALQEEFTERSLAMAQRMHDTQIKLTQAEAHTKRQVMLQTIGNAVSAGAALFGNNKAYASAQAAVNTALAVTSVLATPPFGPWTLALAASVGALGAAQIAKINSSSIGSGSGVGAFVPNVGGGGGGLIFPGGGGPRATEVHIFIEGTGFVQDITSFARTISGEIDAQLNRVGATT